MAPAARHADTGRITNDHDCLPLRIPRPEGSKPGTGQAGFLFEPTFEEHRSSLAGPSPSGGGARWDHRRRSGSGVTAGRPLVVSIGWLSRSRCSSRVAGWCRASAASRRPRRQVAPRPVRRKVNAGGQLLRTASERALPWPCPRGQAIPAGGGSSRADHAVAAPVCRSVTRPVATSRACIRRGAGRGRTRLRCTAGTSRHDRD
jgi:hypothetical protein